MLSIFITPSTDIWHDPLNLTLLTVLAAFLASLFGDLIAYRIWLKKQRVKKEITYQILTDAPIVSFQKHIASINTQVKGRLQILFDQKPVENLSVLTLKVWNSGNVDVKIWNSKEADAKYQEDDKPIRFEFEGRKVVSFAGLETEPKDDVLDPEDLNAYLSQEPLPSLEQDFIELPRCILKPKQSIELTLLLTGGEGRIIRRGKLFNGNIVLYKYSTNFSNMIDIFLIIILTTSFIFLSVFAIVSIYINFSR